MKDPNAPHLSRAHCRSRRHARPTQPPPNIEHSPRSDNDIPCWLPTQASDLGLPRSVQKSLTRIIRPAYRAFVLEAPGELARTIDHFATDSMPPRVPDPVQSPLSDARPVVHPQSESENARPVDQLDRPVRQAFQPDSSSPKATTELENGPSVDQLDRAIRQAFQPAPSSPKATTELENGPSVDQLTTEATL